MDKSKMIVIGHFGFGKELLNGQTVKTRSLTDELKRQLGDGEVICVDTHSSRLKLIKTLLSLFVIAKRAENAVMLPAHNGVKVLTPILLHLRRMWGIKLHYVVIGGWISEIVKVNNSLRKGLKKFDGIYVETNTMKRSMEAQGFRNVFLMPNCKSLRILSREELIYTQQPPLKLCTFSRVMKEKGIEDAVNAVKEINSAEGKTVFELDIYGQIDSEQTVWFRSLESRFPEYIKYRGLVDYDKSTETIKDYFALLFPTKFYTEGIPGTIIDAYCAGVPVLSAKWESCEDIIRENETGYCYEFDDYEELVQKLRRMADAPDEFNKMKLVCLAESEKFKSETVVKEFISNIE